MGGRYTVKEPLTLPGMVGVHPRMRELYHLVHRAARADVPVLVVGETGTGKELVARSLHDLSDARSGEFVDINCAAFSDGMFEGELFGWKKGAFTGSVGDRKGLVAAANGGTLFLDEICSMPLHLQAKLLRVIEDRLFRPLGASSKSRSDFRVVAAASMSPGQMLAEGRIRPDLLYRLGVITIEVPPLRERGTDINRLAEWFASQTFSGSEMCRCLVEKFKKYSWPGNVRELKAVIQRLSVTVDEEKICAHHLDFPRVEDGDLETVLEQVRWDVGRAARQLGVSRSTLYRRMRELRIRRPQMAGGGVAD